MKLISRTEKGFKPCLAPNSKAGESIDVEKMLYDIAEWLLSTKRDGVRTEILTEKALSRALKPIPSIQVNRMAKEFSAIAQHEGIVEAEFYAHGMNVGEIIHFFNTDDVTSDHSKKKYDALWKKTKQGTDTFRGKVGGIEMDIAWKYPGRDPEWLTQWHPELKFHVFDHLRSLDDTRGKHDRYLGLMDLFGNRINQTDEPNAVLIPQFTLENTDAVYQAYDQAILDGYEGLFAVRKTAQYKFGRFSLKENQAYKLKDDNQWFQGIVKEVVEGTIAKEGSEKTINELGRSKTSQLQEDREPSGMATGLLTKLDDGRMLTVSLKGYDHADRRHLLTHPEQIVGKRINFSGMNPTKEGGVPRHAIYQKNNFL